MASITQTIPNYTSGISEQPDHFKNPGQVSEASNVMPDVTTGLLKRPGSLFITRVSTPSASTYFHYYRDQTEQYIGQVERNSSGPPLVKLWALKDIPALNITAGQELIASYSDTNTSDVEQYLKHTDTEQLQFLTVNDYTYIVNRSPKKENGTNNPCAMLPDLSDGWGNNGVGHANAAFIELKKTSNARQYGLNINAKDNTTLTTVTTATRVRNKKTYPNHHVYNHTGSIMVRYNVSTGADIYTDAPADFGFNNVSADERNEYTLGGPFHTRHWADYAGDAQRPWQYADRNEGSCSDIGTKVISTGSTADILANGLMTVYNSSNTELNTTELMAGRANLIWRWTTKGTSGTQKDHESGSNTFGFDYICKYEYDIELLHGGEHWQVGDYIKFRHQLPFNQGRDRNAKIDVTYFLEIEEITTEKIKATVTTSGDGLIRPTPTAFDQDTAVTAGSILGGIKTAIGSLLGTADTTVEQIGNGLYINSANAFNITTSETDLVNIMTDEINDVGKLPSQCKHGYVVLVANSDGDEDDYYMRFHGNNDSDGPGVWKECTKPGIKYKIDPATMPVQLIRNANGTFTIQQTEWGSRQVGDNVTNPKPSFISTGTGSNTTDVYLNKLLYWRNRIVALSSINAIASQPGDDNITSPNFWGKTALTVSPQDCIDISASTDKPANLVDGIEIGQGLLIFSENQQFLLSAEAEVLTPETAKLVATSTYNYNTKIPPISLGSTIAFLDNAGKRSRFFEATNIQRGLEPEILDQTAVVPNLLPKNIDILTNSKENTCVFFNVEGTNEVFGYRYFNSGEKRIQSAWFKWILNKPVKYMAIIDDLLFVIHDNNNLVKYPLVDKWDNWINEMPIHLDNWSYIKPQPSDYNSSTNKTTFALTGYGFDTNTTVAVLDHNLGDDLGRYAIGNVSNNILTLSGDWSSTDTDRKIIVGYNFEMNVKFPTIYPVVADKSADINSSLVIHRLKLSLGAAGVYETTIERVGKDTYKELIESSLQDSYVANQAPWVEQRIHTLPTYERNKNLTVYLKSTHPSPTTLYSMSWEGDYTNKFYQRA
tara:strand:- start:346 stop:3510 length:3165 start_codon:yes stop_codon:yes gene_type:complete